MGEAFPQNLMSFTQRFVSDEACAAYLMELRWPAGFICPACGGGKGWPTARGTIFLCHVPATDFADRGHDPAQHPRATAGLAAGDVAGLYAEDGPERGGNWVWAAIARRG